MKHIATCLILLLGLFSTAYAAVSYYNVELSQDEYGGYYATGYANLDWSNPNDLRGNLCLTPPNGRPLKLPLQGKALHSRALQLTIPSIADLRFLANELSFKKFEEQLFGGTKMKVDGWKALEVPVSGPRLPVGEQQTVPKLYIQLLQIPPVLHSFVLNPNRDEDDSLYTFRNASRPDGIGIFQLRRYDSLTKEQVISQERRVPPYVGDGGYTKGLVLAVVPIEQLNSLRSFLSREGDGASFEDPAFGACGAPFVYLNISVPPFLEFYYVRKLQLSGLVVAAYVEGAGAGTDLGAYSIDDPRFAQMITDPSVPVKTKDQQLWNAISGNIVAFAETRRADFKETGTIARLQGQVLAIRMEIVGPALSECTRNRWEKIVLQVIPQTTSRNGEVTLLFQIVDGFFAPGSSNRRPDDARMRENRIPDGDLERLKELIGGFLWQGFVRDFFLARGKNPPAAPPPDNGDIISPIGLGCRF